MRAVDLDQFQITLLKCAVGKIQKSLGTSGVPAYSTRSDHMIDSASQNFPKTSGTSSPHLSDNSSILMGKTVTIRNLHFG